MSYDPSARERSHHLWHLVARHKEGAAWHEIAGMYRNGRRSNSDIIGDFKSTAAFEAAIREETGLTKTELLRMAMTLSRVEDVSGGQYVQDMLSSDMQAVENATRIAWTRPPLGRSLLLDLAQGNVTPEEVAVILDEVENRVAGNVADPDGVHAHWAAYDKNLEMLEFNRLHVLFARGELVAGSDYSRLVRLSHAAGYGHADSFLTDFGHDGSADSPEAAAHRSSFENYMDGNYWNAINRSERLLSGARPAGSDRLNVGLVCSAMRDAYERGRSQRIERDAPPSPPSP